MRKHHQQILDSGAEVVAIGTGDVRYAKDFIEQEDIPFTVLVDGEGDAARAAGVRRASLTKLMGPSNWMGAVRATARGHRQRRTGARPDQLGATFVIRHDGSVAYAHYADDAADNPPMEEVLAAVEAG